jgi:hypothetical protein
MPPCCLAVDARVEYCSHRHAKTSLLAKKETALAMVRPDSQFGSFRVQR